MQTEKNPYRKLAPLFAFLIPGAGHLALGLHLRGLLLLTGTLTDIVAMIRFADESGGKFALLLVYLGMALPIFWFFSVFDTLQQSVKLQSIEEGQLETQQQAGALAWFQGVAIITMGLLLLALVRAPSMLIPWVDAVGTFAPGIGLFVLAAVLAFKRNERLKMGRFTAAIVIIAVGAMLLSDQFLGRKDIELLGQWWPVVFVLLGMEVVLFSLIQRAGGKRLSFDIGGTFLALVIAVTAFGITHYSAMPFSWLDNFKVNISGLNGYGEEKGFKYEKEILTMPIDEDTSAISIQNPNGKVSLKKGNVRELIVETVVWVDLEDKQLAEQVAQNSKIEISGESKLKIEAKGQAFGNNGTLAPRMNMTITIPEESHIGQLPIQTVEPSSEEITETSGLDDSSKIENMMKPSDNDPSGSEIGEGDDTAASETGVGQEAVDETPLSSGDQQSDGNSDGEQNADTDDSEKKEAAKTEVNIQVGNGSVDVTGLVLPGGLQVKLTIGEIVIDDMTGPVKAETRNGGINVTDSYGFLQLQTYNGPVKAERIHGDVESTTLSGNIDLSHITGYVDAGTKNGGISIREAEAAVKADTLNGDIVIHSAIVGGNWNIDSSIGIINVFIPADGNYSVNGSVTFGNVSTDLPLDAKEKTVTGDIGDATYRINIDANSSIQINHYTP
ncbi:DUF4097 family beta strand repeat-containing protein [Paenibacillus nasutitermitis]|uniref:DUF4097 domain-containing protein n=1 Tax=Paenibacillus nasutitermitis TaxID=1652958 RepID=A0A916ZK22_9BACL|nr:DUF4097 family beta strand repeat-containing protein [Paenibacillus nasutitermitis]GGE01699.1 hypothetical protein GCM10010911_70810 [Paenibacillus nasutitermitis]